MKNETKIRLTKCFREASDMIIARQNEPGWADKQRRYREEVEARSAEFLGVLESGQRESLARRRDARYRG